MMSEEMSRTSAEGLTVPAALWQRRVDEEGRLTEIRNASFHRGRIVLHGIPTEEQPGIRTLLAPLREFVGGVVSRRRFDDLFEFTPEPLRWSECVRVEERCALFLSPWHVDNAYHLHADNLLPMFASLRRAGVLDAPRVLYLHPGDEERNARPAILWELMSAMFDGAVESIASLGAAGGRVGLRRIIWGRGPRLLYLRDVRATPHSGVAGAYRSWALGRLGVTERPATAAGARPRVLYMARSGPRSLSNQERLLEAFADVGLDARLFDAWKDTSAADLVSLVHGRDVLLGVHGAALIHLAYMPPGSMVVELLPAGWAENPVFSHASHHFCHRHVAIDLSGAEGPPGGIEISPDEAAAIARRVVAEWEQRGRPRTMTVRSLGTGNWGNEVFWYMFAKTYARRFGLRFESDGWAGNELVGADDPPIGAKLPDVVEKTEHGVFDTLIPHGPPRADVNFVGYFQYHTSHYRPDRAYIQDLFRPAPEVAAVLEPRWMALRERGGIAVALHVRRRDYGFRYFYRAPTKWYLDLLERLWPELDRPFLYVATDDPDEVLRDFAEYNPLSAADLGPPLPRHDFYRDFYALQHSDVLGISNSSFSFAAAMLNTGLQRAYRPHLPSRRLIPFDPWDDKPLQQEPAFHVERYPWLPEVWRPTPARKRWAESGRFLARGLRERIRRGARHALWSEDVPGWMRRGAARWIARLR